MAWKLVRLAACAIVLISAIVAATLSKNTSVAHQDPRIAALAQPEGLSGNRDVVEHYNAHFKLQLTEAEINDLVEYLKSL